MESEFSADRPRPHLTPGTIERVDDHVDDITSAGPDGIQFDKRLRLLLDHYEELKKKDILSR